MITLCTIQLYMALHLIGPLNPTYTVLRTPYEGTSIHKQSPRRVCCSTIVPSYSDFSKTQSLKLTADAWDLWSSCSTLYDPKKISRAMKPYGRGILHHLSSYVCIRPLLSLMNDRHSSYLNYSSKTPQLPSPTILSPFGLLVHYKHYSRQFRGASRSEDHTWRTGRV